MAGDDIRHGYLAGDVRPTTHHRAGSHTGGRGSYRERVEHFLVLVNGRHRDRSGRQRQTRRAGTGTHVQDAARRV
jgi:hypothetical protein